MHLRTPTLAGVTVFRVCLSSNTHLVVKSRQRLQSNLRRRTNSLQALAHIKAESRDKTSTHIHKCVGCLVEPIIQRYRHEIVILRQHKEVHGTYRAFKTAPASMLRVWALVLALSADSNGHTSRSMRRSLDTGGIKCIGSVLRLEVSIIMTSHSFKIADC